MRNRMQPLVVENVVKRYRQGDREVHALAGVSLEVGRGQFLAVMGASGSGKSTLLHLMAGLTQPNEGRVVIAGEDISVMNDRQLTLFRRRQIGLVFQAFNLIPTLTAEENILLPLMLDGRNGEAGDAKVESTRDLGSAFFGADGPLTKLVLTVLRDGKEVPITLELPERP